MLWLMQIASVRANVRSGQHKGDIDQAVTQHWGQRNVYSPENLNKYYQQQHCHSKTIWVKQ